MTAKSQPLGLRLFLEGIEVPVISAQVNAVPNQPATASIQIVPTDTALNLLPRTLVHLFELNDSKELGGYEEVRTTTGGLPENNNNRFEAQDTAYKTAFTGEVIGLNYGKDPGARQLVLQCMDLSSYWDTAYQWFADYSPNGDALYDRRHNFVGAGSGTFNNIAGGHQWVLGQLITTKPKSKYYKDTKGLLAGILHVLEAIGGIRYEDGENPGFNGVNDFFTIAELRYNLMGMLGAVASDTTSARLYESKAFISWLRNGMTSMGSMLSFRDMINHICQTIFHDIYPNPSPYYVPGNIEKQRVVVGSSIFTDDPLGAKAKNDILASYEILGKIYKRTQTFYWSTSDFAYLKENLKAALNYLNEATFALGLVKTDDIRDIKAATSNATSLVRTAYDSASKGIESEGDYKIPERVEEALKVLDNDILGPSSRARRSKKKTLFRGSGAHLYSQLLLPETFWVAPPRCNVIFPDQYYQFSYSRNFMREVSRLCLTGGPGLFVEQGRGSFIFNSNYYAPNIKDVRGNLLGSSMSSGARTLLPHELHTGIIPKFEWITDAHRWGAKSLKDGGSQNPQFSSGKIGYLQRLANFNFYLHRWSARSISITGIYNPNLVLGFPCVVIDRSMPSSSVIVEVESILQRTWRPTQFLGKIVSLTHAINQGGGTTQVDLAYCRTHQGVDDEFLGVLSLEKQNSVEKLVSYSIDVAKITSTSPLSQEEPPPKASPLISEYSTEFLTGTPISVQDERDLVVQFASKKLKVGGVVKGIRSFEGLVIKSASQSGEVQISRSEAATYQLDWAALDAAALVSSDGVAYLPEKVTFKFVKKLAIGKPRQINMAIEDALMPGWYSDVWRNKNITKNVYGPLLGTQAITDVISLSTEELSKVIQDSAKKELEEAGVTTKSADNVTKMDVVTGSVEEAINSLTAIYSMVKNGVGNVHEFIREYTTRPIANMRDVLGSYDLEFDDSGNPVGEGYEGFHSRAFGDYNAEVSLPGREGVEMQAGKDALKALFPGVSLSRVRSLKRKSLLDRGKSVRPIRPEMDPRGKARLRVKAYVAELSVSRGLSG